MGMTPEASDKFWSWWIIGATWGTDIFSSLLGSRMSNQDLVDDEQIEDNMLDAA